MVNVYLDSLRQRLEGRSDLQMCKEIVDRTVNQITVFPGKVKVGLV